MAFNSIEEILEDYRLGKMVLLVDDEDRKTKATCCSPPSVARRGHQLHGPRSARPDLPDPDRRALPAPGPGADGAGNGSVFSTAFTVSIEAASGVTTGISAADRARTVAAAVAQTPAPKTWCSPATSSPARPEGGVLTRAGHTEAGCDLARLAGFTPASVIVEVLNDDGTMARRPDLEVFARKHGIKIGTIADLIHYRLSTEQTIKRIGERELPTVHGTFRLVTFEDRIEGGVHMAMVMGDIRREQPTLVRVHVIDPLRDLVGAEYSGPSNWTLWAALQRVAAEGVGWWWSWPITNRPRRCSSACRS
jgi:3,4-dihydroxy 2-butanone 4-phosphate synthase/GTP cyclohydrolase II